MGDDRWHEEETPLPLPGQRGLPGIGDDVPRDDEPTRPMDRDEIRALLEVMSGGDS